MTSETVVEVLVIGGGLAGLTAATSVAASGSQVVCIEARSHVGGRAQSSTREGFTFNQGPHALYKASEAVPILKRLGVTPRGGNPMRRTAWVSWDGVLRPLPVVLATEPKATAEMLRFLRGVGLPRENAAPLSTKSWLDTCTSERARDVLAMLTRLTSYSRDLEHYDASSAHLQLRRGLKGVLYLHGGWQSVVDQLRSAALDAGVEFVTGHKVSSVEPGALGFLVTAGQVRYRATSVIIACGGPAEVHRMVPDASPTLSAWAAQARPISASTLSLGLRSLPKSKYRNCLGGDEAWYTVTHTPTARLADQGGEAVFALRYEPELVGAAASSAVSSPDFPPDFPPDSPPDSPTVGAGTDWRTPLEEQLDCCQPGWRAEVVAEEPGRHLLVAHDRPQPIPLESRPQETVPEIPGLFVAGDWLTRHSQLADASVGSGVRASVLAAQHLSQSS